MASRRVACNAGKRSEPVRNIQCAAGAGRLEGGRRDADTIGIDQQMWSDVRM